jgi:SAM-dependent methyltransferase
VSAIDPARSSISLPAGRCEGLLRRWRKGGQYRLWQRMLHRLGHRRDSRFSLLEVGCGGGFFLRCCGEWFPRADLVGGDIDPRHVAFARRNCPRARIEQLDGRQLAFAPGSFDVLAAIQVIEHLDQPAAFLHQCRRVLREGGVLLLATPNPQGLAARLLGPRWQGRHPDHVSLLSPPRLRGLLGEAGFAIVRDGTTGLSGLPLVGRSPLMLVNVLIQGAFGCFGWRWGESYVAAARKVGA